MTTRRNVLLKAAAGVALATTATAFPVSAGNADGELLALFADWQRAVRACDDAPKGMDDAVFGTLTDEITRCGEALLKTPARTVQGIQAKVEFMWDMIQPTDPQCLDHQAIGSIRADLSGLAQG